MPSDMSEVERRRREGGEIAADERPERLGPEDESNRGVLLFENLEEAREIALGVDVPAVLDGAARRRPENGGPLDRRPPGEAVEGAEERRLKAAQRLKRRVHRGTS